VVVSDEEGTNSVTLNANSEGYVDADELQAAVETLYGKNPTARTLNLAVSGYTVIDGQSVKTTGETTATVSLDAPFIDSGYWLTGDFAGWNKDGALQFSHSDADVYDDPYFTIVFTTTADNQYWKIISQTNYDGDFWAGGETGVVGVTTDGDTSTSGSLTTDNPGAGKIETAGMYKLTINMMDYTYEITPVAPQFYMVGALPGWSEDGAKTALLYPTSATVMSYTSKYTGAWDLKLWNKNDLGNWDVAYGCVNDGDNSESGTLTNSGAGAISAPSAEYYTFSIDLSTMTYTWTKLSDQSPTEFATMGIAGSFNGWSFSGMTQVTPHNWYVQTTLSEGDEIKFLSDSSWANNWGTDLTVTSASFYGTGTQNGANIKIGESGTYNIYLNDITGEFAFVVEE